MAPRKRKEYEEKPPDESGTPFERFERALKKVLSVPKERVKGREAQGRKTT